MIAMIAPLGQTPQTDDPDALLMARVRDGELELFDELMMRHQHRVVSAITRLMGTRSYSEDLAQQVFMKIFNARARYTPTAKFSTWLFRITVNVASNARRSLARQAKTSVQPVSGWPSEQLDNSNRSTELDPYEHAVKVETMRTVRQAVGELGKRQQQAIQLVYFHGYRYRAAGQQMDLSEKAVKSLVHRAKSNLEELLTVRLVMARPR